MAETITEQGELVGICGWNGSSWEPILIDGTNRLVIAVASSGLPSGAATSAKQLADGHNVNISNAAIAVLSGDDKILGFESIVEESLANLDLGAGPNTLTGETVGAGKVWLITGFCIQYEGTMPTQIQVYVAGLASALYLWDVLLPTVDHYHFWDGRIFLQEGDGLVARVYGATLNDNLTFRYVGVQMDAP